MVTRPACGRLAACRDADSRFLLQSVRVLLNNAKEAEQPLRRIPYFKQSLNKCEILA